MSAPSSSRFAAFAASVAAALWLASAAAQPAGIEDIQIGEKDRMLRIALVCPGDCAVRSSGPRAFLVEGPPTEMRIDLSRRSVLADAIVIGAAPGGEGSLLTVEGRTDISRATLSACRVSGVKGVCLDFTFAPDGASDRAEPARVASGALGDRVAGVQLASGAGDDAGSGKAAPDEPMTRAPTTPELATPELATPALATPAPQKPGPKPEPKSGPKPEPRSADDPPPPPLRERAALPAPLLAAAVAPIAHEGSVADLRPGGEWGAGSAPATSPAGTFDLRTEAEAALGRPFDAGACGAAKARLQADPWALDAMADAALCKAIAGDIAGADGDLKRLLSYMPGHATALVGRALIAAVSGRRAEADRLFQGALDAPATFDEASRLLAARARLTSG